MIKSKKVEDHISKYFADFLMTGKNYSLVSFNTSIKILLDLNMINKYQWLQLHRCSLNAYTLVNDWKSVTV